MGSGVTTLKNCVCCDELVIFRYCRKKFVTSECVNTDFVPCYFSACLGSPSLFCHQFAKAVLQASLENVSSFCLSHRPKMWLIEIRIVLCKAVQISTPLNRSLLVYRKKEKNAAFLTAFLSST